MITLSGGSTKTPVLWGGLPILSPIRQRVLPVDQTCIRWKEHVPPKTASFSGGATSALWLEVYVVIRLDVV